MNHGALLLRSPYGAQAERQTRW